MLDVKKIKFWNAVTELIYQYLKHKIKDKKSRESSSSSSSNEGPDLRGVDFHFK